MTGSEHQPDRGEGIASGAPEAEEMTEFVVIARALLADAGLPCTSEDLQWLTVVAQVLGPGLAALDAIDVRSFAPEHDLDPGRPPR
jgi:hypothetical protein